MLEMPRGPKYGDVFEITIQGVTEKGRGWGTFDCMVGPQRDPRQYRVEVRKAMPGDVVEAILEGRKRRTLEARIGRIVTPSPERREPRCRHFGPREIAGKGCGGCTLQALNYPAQLVAKRALVQQLLQREDIEAPIAAADEWYYRNKMEFSFGDDKDRAFALGLRPTGWHREVVPLQECFLQDEDTLDIVNAVREWADGLPLSWLIQLTVRSGKRTGERLVNLMTRHDASVMTANGERPAASVAAEFAEVVKPLCNSVWWTQERAVEGERTSWQDHHLDGAVQYYDEIHAPDGRQLRLGVPLRAFFQPNPLTAERILEVVVAALDVGTAGDGGGASNLTLVDLYCGTGTMGLGLASSLNKVIGVELVPEAVEAAKTNAATNGVDNAHYLAGDCAKVLASEEFKALLDGRTPDVVLVDPPRAGLQGKSVALTASLGAPRIVYVSCGPKALARDLKALEELGYKAGVIQPVDLFPQTQHIENIVVLSLTK